MNTISNHFKAFYNTNFNKIIRYIRHLNLFKRLILSFLLIIFIPNLLIGYFSFIKFSREMDSTITKSSAKALNNLNISITERLKKYSDLSYKLYLNNELKDLLRKCGQIKKTHSETNQLPADYDEYKERIGNILYAMSYPYPEIINLEILSDFDEFTQIGENGRKAGGRISDPIAFRNSSNYKKAITVANLPVWWDTSKETSTYISELFPKAYIGNYVTTLRAISEPGMEKPLGIIIINISSNSFSSILTNDEALAQGGNLVLLGDTVIKYFNPQADFVRLDSMVIKDIKELNTGSAVKKISGKEYLITAVKSGFTGWTLSLIIPRKSLMQSVYEIRNLILLICLLCTLFAMMISYFVTVSISQPIRNLKTTMGQIGQVDEKNIEVLYNDDLDDEVGILGQKFNSMIKRIRNLINTVYEAELIKKEEMLRRREAELDALQMQINPHFLYNTLDIIRWQVISQENGEGKASHMISAFSDLLRLGTKISANLVKICEEIDHVNAYVDVVRFDIAFKLNIRYLIEDDAILDCRIPKLTLQPLIENAIVHGFQHHRTEGEIVIKAYIKNTDLFIEIKDNGTGISENAVEMIRNDVDSNERKSKNIGLRNVNERIKLNFGECYGISLESKVGEYTAATIRIPHIQKDEEKTNVQCSDR